MDSRKFDPYHEASRKDNAEKSYSEASMIHRFRVQNFKSLVDVSVDLEPVTVLVGKSGTGKSNFVEAIRTLRDLLRGQQHTQEVHHQTWQQTRPANSPDSQTRFEVEFSIKGIPDTFLYKLALSKHSLHHPPDEELLQLGKRDLFHQQSGQHQQSKWIVDPGLFQNPQAGEIALRRIPSVSEIVVALTALTSGIGCYSFHDQVLSSPVGANGQTIGLNDNASNYIDVLKSIASNLEELHVRKSIVDALQRVNPSVSSIELNDIQNPNHIVVGHNFNGKTLALQLGQESDGFRRFFAHLLALYQRPPKQTLIFEHPEDGIHPGALALLAEEFKAAPEDRRGQVLLTTHSPRLLDHFDVDQIRVVELDGFETRIGPVSQAQRDAIRENLLDPGELLTVDPARLDEAVSESAEA